MSGNAYYFSCRELNDEIDTFSYLRGKYVAKASSWLA